MQASAILSIYMRAAKRWEDEAMGLALEVDALRQKLAQYEPEIPVPVVDTAADENKTEED